MPEKNTKTPNPKPGLSKEQESFYFAAIVESTDDAVLSKNLKGIITSWNQGAEKLYGYSAKEIIGKSVAMLFPKNRYREHLEIMRKIRKGETIEHHETVRVTKDKRLIDVSVAISPVRDESGKLIGASSIGRDISKRKQLEKNQNFLIEAGNILFSSLDYAATLKSVAKLVVPNIADWFAIDMLDERGQPWLLTLAHINPKKVEWGYRLREKFPINMSDSTGIPAVLRSGKPELYSHISDSMLQSVALNAQHLKIMRQIGFESAMVVPLVARRKVLGAMSFVSSTEGGHFYQEDLDLAMELARRIAMAIDNAVLYQNAQREIFERKKTESQLRSARNQLEIIFQNVLDGITVQDKNGKLIFANDAAAKATGFQAAEEMLNTPSSKIFQRFLMLDRLGNPFPPEKLPGRRALKGEKHPREIICYREIKDGSQERWVDIKATPVLDDEGKVALVVNVMADITERELAEKRKDDFISIASHELKTPITSMKVFAQLLQKKVGKQNGQENLRLVLRMDDQLNRLTKLIEDLLDVSRIQANKLALHKEQFSLGELAKEVVENLQGVTAHKLIIDQQSRVKVSADRDRIGQVLTNLLTNAIKYSPDAKKVIVGVKSNSKEAVVSVEDFGIGISPKHQPQVFERFFRAEGLSEKTFPGLGIGLYFSAEVIKRHGGKIWVESEKGKGSTFYFSLPIR